MAPYESSAGAKRNLSRRYISHGHETVVVAIRTQRFHGCIPSVLHQDVPGHEVSTASHVQHKFFSERRYLHVVSPVNPHGAHTAQSYDAAIPVNESGLYHFGVYDSFWSRICNHNRS